MSRWRWNVLTLMLISALLFIQYRLWFEADGVRDLLRLRKKIAVQEAENNNLKKHNDELLSQVQRLQNSHDAVESRARNELGMVKKGETFYQIVK